MARNGKGSKPVCWDCGERIPLDNQWRRFEPAVVAPPAAVHVCGSSCQKTPPGRQVFHTDELLRGIGV